jgi:hypothetical protein
MLRFKGWPLGQKTTVSVNDGDDTTSATVRRWRTPYPTHTLEAPSTDSFGVSVTVTSPRDYFVEEIRPKGRLHTQIVTQTDGRRLAMDWQMDNANVLRDRAWIGATVEVYRVLSGSRVFVGSYGVTDANFGQWHLAGASPRTAYTQADGFSHFNPSFGQPDEYWDLRPRWYGVAAVDGSNQIGPIAYAEYTPSSLQGGYALPNDNTLTLSADYTPGSALPAPGNVTATPDASSPATANISHDPVPGAVGYIHFLSWDDPATHPTFKFIEVDGDGIEPGDEIIVRQKFLTFDPDVLATRTMVLKDSIHGVSALFPGERYPLWSLYATQGIIDASLVPYDGPEVAAGDWALRYQIAATAVQAPTNLFVDFWNAQPTQNWYHVAPVGARYRMLARVWASRAAQVTLDIGLTGAPTSSYALSPGWQTLELQGTATGEATNVLAARILYTPDGAPIEIRLAGIDLTPVDSTGLFSDDIAEQMLPGMVVRDHTFIKVMPNGYEIEDLLSANYRGPRAYSVHQFLTSCAAASVKPWLQIEPFLTPAEWVFFGDYLCAPVSSGTPGALRRQALGRTAPWSEAFDEMLLEFGNEAWNGIPAFFNPPGNATDRVTGAPYDRSEYYGLMARQGAQTLQASPHWPTHITFVLGGWAANAFFSAGALRGFRAPCYVGIANYNGGWDTGGNLVSEDDASYQNTLASAAASQIEEMDNLVAALQSVCTEVGLTYGTDVRPTCYEAGPGYQLNGLNGASVSPEELIVQEVVMKSRAAGTATLHTALAQAARGFAHFNFFVLGQGDLWKSHAPFAQGGATYPQWQVIRKLHELYGQMQVFEAPAAFPEQITVQNNAGQDVTIDNTFVYGITSLSQPQRQGFVVGNIGLERQEICRIDTGWSTITNLSSWTLNGPYAAHNRYPVGQRLTPDGTYIADPKSGPIDISGMSLTVPSDLTSVLTDDGLGFGAEGVGMGNCGFFVVDF